MLKSKKKKAQKLQEILDSLDVYETPNIALEQYATPPHLAAQWMNIMAENTGEVEGKIIGDLGCGCGTLTIAAAVYGAEMCVGFDIDKSALEIAQRNKEDLELQNVDFVQCDVMDLNDSRWHKAFDTVVLNPPFGTKGNKGIDMMFLKTALSLARNSVYSLHKSSTIEHIKKKAKEWNVTIHPMYKMIFNLNKSYHRHKSNLRDIEVSVIRFILPEANKINL
ncbi:rRNA N6-adenosine-methyltransferase METTL5 [Caerostris darwini]|uniref:rRNA N6-adenosine-methyltransferase METTL5 n=1 Tax=Caerostris darwini TaxID=1538125 RepID=A0AAV4SY58_9ARAC|nr:rRNA N6-adenosine-methyltransferase METTL5 [Caerostris darwini]